MMLPLPRRVAAAFAFALLCIVAVGLLQHRTVTRLDENSGLISHTYEVLQHLDSLHTLMDRAGIAAQTFVVTGQGADLASYTQTADGLRAGIQSLRQLTADNAAQQQKLDQFDPLLREVLLSLEKKTDLRQAGTPSPVLLLPLESSIEQNAAAAHALLEDMQNTEFSLLRQRNEAVATAIRQTDILIVLGSLVSFALLAVATLTLVADIDRRRRSEDNLRTLSGRLLQVQEQERRLIARELHDSLGQYMVALKMELHGLQGEASLPEDGAKQRIAGCIELAEQCLAEVRIVTHLLYPPLLDELGLPSAARSYVEGFAKRSSIQATFEIAPDFGPMPRDVEVALFRVLQESLTNIHRHSGSHTARVRFFVEDGLAGLEVSDEGRGIPPERLAELRQELPGRLGVGLRGMNERMRQFGGKLYVSSNDHGTTLIVSIPSAVKLPHDESVQSVAV